MLFAPRCRRAMSEKAVICFCPCLYQVLSHILGVSLPPSACSNPLCRHPPPSSEGGEGAPAPYTEVVKVQAAIKPAGAGCPHPSRCSAKAQHRATFPKGKAERSRAAHGFNRSGEVCKSRQHIKICALFAARRTYPIVSFLHIFQGRGTASTRAFVMHKNARLLGFTS